MHKFAAKIIDPIGLHARPAALITKEASKYVSKITLSSKGKEANLKSIMNIMALGVKQNESFEVVAEGEDSKKALLAIKQVFIDNKLISE